MSRDQRVDAYIARQAEFARPILERLREAFHCAGPAIEEGLKWGAPAFLYKGKQIAIMAAFKAHATLSFQRGEEVTGKAAGAAGAMGQFGRLTSLDDLPPDEELAGYVRKAMALIDEGRKPAPAGKKKPPLPVPGDLRAALDAEPAAAATFESFAPSHRREYVEWVIEAKRSETRARRIAQAVALMAEGKKKNWKYEKC
ncbi:MAG: YdeI/OmpD-associated family protein [Sphingomonadaceae bacterium]